jgi:hypothetical protein
MAKTWYTSKTNIPMSNSGRVEISKWRMPNIEEIPHQVKTAFTESHYRLPSGGLQIPKYWYRCWWSKLLASVSARSETAGTWIFSSTIFPSQSLRRQREAKNKRGLRLDGPFRVPSHDSRRVFVSLGDGLANPDYRCYPGQLPT